jgi:hypothetical protein
VINDTHLSRRGWNVMGLARATHPTRIIISDGSRAHSEGCGERRQVYAACAGLVARVSNHVIADARAKRCALVRSRPSFETPAARAPQDEDRLSALSRYAL